MLHSSPMRIIVALSTIPSRLAGIPKTVDSLLAQSRVPDEIHLNIATTFHRFDEQIYDDDIPTFNSPSVRINRCDDCGPGTKLMGSLPHIRPEDIIILVDDDMAYKPYLIDTLVRGIQTTDTCCTYYAYDVQSKHNTYTVGQGADGFGFKGKWLTALPEFYDIVRQNEYLFFHDDLWLSYYLKRQGIAITNMQTYWPTQDPSYVPDVVYTTLTDQDGLFRLKGKYRKSVINKKGLTFLEKNAPIHD